MLNLSHPRGNYAIEGFDVVGDVDWDGVNDIVVGEASTDFSGAIGFAYVFSGATTAMIHTVSSGIPSSGANFGTYVAGIPDVNGDARSDFAVAAPFDSPPPEAGRIYVYSGVSGTLLRILSSPQPRAYATFGRGVRGAPDMNGDGRGEIIATSLEPREPGEQRLGVIYVFSGATGALLHRLPSYGTTSSVPDVNGDRVPDIVIGDVQSDNFVGSVFVYSGSTGTLLYTLRSPTAPEIYSQFGASVAGIPDIDGDGRGDILVGAVTEVAPGYPPLRGPGAAYLFSGATGTLLRRFDSTSPIQVGFFGYSVAAVPDCNDDGLQEVLVSAEQERRAYLFLSCAADWDRSGTLTSQDLFAYINSFLSFTPYADFNRDGVVNSQDFFDYLGAYFAGCP